MPRPLNPQEEQFVLEYMLDFDAGRAALAAGFRNRGTGFNLLKKPRIADSIEVERSRRREKYRIDGDKIMEEFAKIGYANSRDYWPAEGEKLDLSRLNSDVTAAISELIIDEQIKDGVTYRRTRLKLHDKQVALVNLAKSQGLLAERRINEHSFEFKLLEMKPEERAELARQLIEEGRKYLPDYLASRAREEETIEVEADEGGALEIEVGDGDDDS